MQVLASAYTNIANLSEQATAQEGLIRSAPQGVISTEASNSQQLYALPQQDIAQRHYDFTSMSRSEYDEMWNNGELGIELPPTVTSKEGLKLTNEMKAQMDSAFDEKINYIEHYENTIKHYKAQLPSAANISALDRAQRSLNKLMDLQGAARQPRVNIQA